MVTSSEWNATQVSAYVWQWSLSLASMSEILEMRVNSYETANTTFGKRRTISCWSTLLSLTLFLSDINYLVVRCSISVIRNFIANSCTPSSSSSSPSFQGFFSITIENYEKFVKSWYFFHLLHKCWCKLRAHF